MFAARVDQENLTYNRQTATAAKNNALGAKTPANKGPKTPFGKRLGNENDAQSVFKAGGKTGGKGEKAVAAEPNAFVTPAPGARSRAPLGQKTTNAKANLKTPGLQTTKKESAQKTISPRLRRAKVKIHQEVEPVIPVEDDVPDIEYMPPRSVPLADDDLIGTIHHEDWSMLRGPNQTAQCWSTYLNPIGEDGLTLLERKHRDFMAEPELSGAELIQRGIDQDPLLNMAIEDMLSYMNEEIEEPVKKPSPVAHRRAPSAAPSSRAPSTLSSRRAASALSTTSSNPTTSGPRFAAPTAAAAARSRTPVNEPQGKKRVPAPAGNNSTSTLMAPTRSSSMRYAAATAASRSTLGYSKGRAISAHARPEVRSVLGAAKERSHSSHGSHSSAGRSEKRTEEETRMQESRRREILRGLVGEDPEIEALVAEQAGEDEAGEEDEGLSAGVHALGLENDEDEFAAFQLDVPEDEE